MIGHFLNALSEVQEDLLLLESITSGGHQRSPEHRCLTMVASDAARDADGRWQPRFRHTKYRAWPPLTPYGPGVVSVPNRYDDLCDRFGTPRVNAAIRNRILANRARRVLRGTAGEVSVVGQ